jgi:hypothetical protein
MSEGKVRQKTGKHFKEFINEEKNKGKTRKAIMKVLTRIDASVMYGFVFLVSFVALDAVIYFVTVPSVFVWAGILIGTALFSSVLANRVTNRLKKVQWKFAS